MSDAAAKYGVEVELKKVGDGWDDLSAGVGKFTSMLDAAAGKLGNLAKYAVVGLGAGAFAAATYGVTQLSSEAEKAAISIGTIFSVNGLAANVPAGVTMAQDQIAKMRVDAQKLPGEFEDLQKIFMTTAIPQFQAGATADQARQLSAQIMAAGAVMGLQSDMTAREASMLLSGRAGAHNVFGTRLGFSGEKAKELNKASPEERLKMVSAETNKYAGAIDIFAHSYEGLSSTLVDNVKNFGRLASAPLFDDVKDTLSDINDWFSKNQGRVNQWALIIGNDLRGAFEWGKREIEEWEPYVENFAGAAIDRIEGLWETVQPGVQAFGQAMKDALSDPNGTIDKLVHLGEIYAGLSLAGGLVGGLGSKSGRAGTGLELAAGGIAAAAVGADGGTIGGQAAEAGSAVGGGALAGSVFGPLGVAAGALAGALMLDVAAYTNLADVKHAGEVSTAQAAFKFAETLYADNEEINNNIGTHVSFGEALANNVSAMDESEAAFATLNAATLEAAGFMAAMFGARGDENTKKIGEEATDTYALGMTSAINKFLGRGGDTAAAKKAPVMKGGHGGTNIQKVEIVVTSNSSPSRIARVVEARLANLSRNRRSSPYVPNYSSRDEGR